MANKKSSSDLSDVTATRDGKTRTFPRLTWNLLGPSKQGWSEVKSAPKELNDDSKDQGSKEPVKTKADDQGTKAAGTSAVQKQLTVAQQKKADAEAAAAKQKETKADDQGDKEKSLTPEEEAAKKISDEEGAGDGEAK